MCSEEESCGAEFLSGVCEGGGGLAAIEFNADDAVCALVGPVCLSGGCNGAPEIVEPEPIMELFAADADQ